MQPEIPGALRGGRERRDEGATDLVGRRQKDGVRGRPLREARVSRGELAVASLELRAVHALIDLQIRVLSGDLGVARVRDEHQRVPDERHVADDRPQREREQERRDPEPGTRLRAGVLAHREQRAPSRTLSDHDR